MAAFIASIVLAAMAAAPASLDIQLKRAEAAGFSGTVAASDGGKVVFEASASSAASAAETPHGLWRWASVTKQVTAVLVMQEVEKGKLALNQPLTAYLPDFAGPTGARITLRQLLQHTSGLPNPDDSPPGDDAFPDFYQASSAADANRSATLGYCSGDPKAEPGAGFSYNNCDYLVLGAILETITGQPYADLIRDRIATPLGLTSLAVYPATPETAPPTVPGRDETGKPEPTINLGTFGAAGALYGTADDMLGFDRSLMGETLLGNAAKATMWQGEPALGYAALGAWSFEAPLAGCDEPVALIERRGAIGGVQVRNLIAPALGRALVVFSDSAATDFGEIWQGAGLSFDFASSAFCAPRP